MRRIILMERYSNERTTLQILEILKQTTDEKHTVSKNELKHLLRLYRIGRHKNNTSVPDDRTFNRVVAEILLELNPGKYTDENDSEYIIKYDGYTEDKLNKKIKPDKRSSQKVETGSAPALNGLHYVHPFEIEKYIAYKTRAKYWRHKRSFTNKDRMNDLRKR